MYKVKCYKYDKDRESNGYRGVGENDYSNYILQGYQQKEDITQELDTGELALVGLPIKDAFLPETKLIVDIVEVNIETGEETILDNYTKHYCVSRDIVEQPILSDENYFDHHLFLIEPSVVAQKRLVDNISVTYRLKDVNFETKDIYTGLDVQINLNFQEAKYTPKTTFGEQFASVTRKIYLGKRFRLGGNGIEVLRPDYSFGGINNPPSWTITTNYYNNIDAKNSDNEDIGFQWYENGVKTGYKAKIQFYPMYLDQGVEDTTSYSTLARVSFDYLILEKTTSGIVVNSYTGSIIENNDLSLQTQGNLLWKNIRKEWLIEGLDKKKILNEETLCLLLRKYVDTTAPNLSFPEDYRSIEFEIKKDRIYEVVVSLHDFNEDIPKGSVLEFPNRKWTYDSPSYETYIEQDINLNWYNNYYHFMSQQNYQGSISFFTYLATGNKEVIYTSASPYSALDLIHKAIINCGQYDKKTNKYIANVNQNDYPFTIDNKYIPKLRATSIIENFYNQKNLWEVLIEAGNYIHAIPEIKFGADDKFLITFNELGRTDLKENSGTRLSIFNSRSVEDYISATSSYVDNMVQLGGYIEETLPPKTLSESLDIDNNTACILTSKPIIELLQVKCICAKDWKIISLNPDVAIHKYDEADLTPFLYEENVYKVLPIDVTKIPNRGIAMYYKLGTNAIIGGGYQSPQQNTTIYSDFAFKKIIYTAFLNYPSQNETAWTNLEVNNFYFVVKYRTKDDVRQDHTRMDLRKYLLNSKYDRVPQHNQFNNQQDVLVDSIKFGNNMFGKLIRTGNNTYTITDWNTDINAIKKKGELYLINGELYYVAKVTTNVYDDLFISEIEYSKDYNELSNVIGIPSEPRFYEISEQSSIRREVAIDDYILLTTNDNDIAVNNTHIRALNVWTGLIFFNARNSARYAITVFKGDRDNYDNSGTTQGNPNLYKEVVSPINFITSQGTLTYAWDMVDNYSAGDKVIDTVKGTFYKSLEAVRYTDEFGKAELFDFYILNYLTIGIISMENARALPECPFRTTITADEGDTRPLLMGTNVNSGDILASNVDTWRNSQTKNTTGLSLLKDNREALSFNYNVSLITSSDQFIYSPFLWLPEKKNVKIVLLNTEVNKLGNGYINESMIINPFTIGGGTMPNAIPISNLQYERTTYMNKNYINKATLAIEEVYQSLSPEHFNGGNLEQVKAIAILADVPLNAGENFTQIAQIPNMRQFVLARNIPSNYTKEEAIENWIFGAPSKNIFKNKQ